uniref:Uncharacterized protein n=1 Tax=Arundo donax TaxID=35708 RepID=A0A0A8Z1M2_ARUDO
MITMLILYYCHFSFIALSIQFSSRSMMCFLPNEIAIHVGLHHL